MLDKIFYSTCFGFIFGVLIGSFVLVNFYIVIFLGLISLFFVLTFSFSKNKWGILFGIFILTFALGILRFNFSFSNNGAILINEVGQKVSLSGIIIDEPTETENNQKLDVRIAKNLEI